MKKLKYRFIKWIATKLNCDDLINWDAYDEVIPLEPNHKVKFDFEMTGMNLLNADSELLKKYYNRLGNKKPFTHKFFEMAQKRDNNLFEHYESPKN